MEGQAFRRDRFGRFGGARRRRSAGGAGLPGREGGRGPSLPRRARADGVGSHLLETRRRIGSGLPEVGAELGHRHGVDVDRHDVRFADPHSGRKRRKELYFATRHAHRANERQARVDSTGKRSGNLISRELGCGQANTSIIQLNQIDAFNVNTLGEISDGNRPCTCRPRPGHPAARRARSPRPCPPHPAPSSPPSPRRRSSR